MPTQNSYLVAVCGNAKKLAVARLELSTGEFTVSENNPDVIVDEILMHSPKELLFPSEDEKTLPKELTGNGVGNLTPLESIYFDFRLSKEKLQNFFDVSHSRRLWSQRYEIRRLCRGSDFSLS